jgi:hypothetical protein
MEIVGKCMSVEQFARYVAQLDLSAWKPSLVVVHHTSAPSLAQRPNGLTQQHILNLRDYYGKELGWSAGPHLFIDGGNIWVFSPMKRKGVHAVSFNRNSWGIEMLGDFDSEDPWNGRGKKVLEMTAYAIRAMLVKLGKNTDAIRFHRDDPKTKKTCPGRKIDKGTFIAMVKTI